MTLELELLEPRLSSFFKHIGIKMLKKEKTFIGLIDAPLLGYNGDKISFQIRYFDLGLILLIILFCTHLTKQQNSLNYTKESDFLVPTRKYCYVGDSVELIGFKNHYIQIQPNPMLPNTIWVPKETWLELATINKPWCNE